MAGTNPIRKEWSILRVRHATLTRLEAVRRTLERATEQGQRDLAPDQRNERIGLDTVIQVLLTEWEVHKERRRRHAAGDGAEERARTEPHPEDPASSAGA
jgi:hypothetical protein